MRYWSWVLTAIAILALVVLIFPLVHTQKQLRLVQTELGRANEQVVQATAATAELEKVVTNQKTELAAANASRTQLERNIADANSKIEQLQKGFDAAQAENEELRAQLDKAKRETEQAQSEHDKQLADLKSQAEGAAAQVTQATADRDTALSKLAETQSQLESVESEFEKAKVANAEASKKLTELQANLDQATAEVERLKTALEQKNAAPPQGADSASSPPIQ